MYNVENAMARTGGYYNDGAFDIDEVHETTIATCDFCGFEITDCDTYFTDGELHICEDKICRLDWAEEQLEKIKP